MVFEKLIETSERMRDLIESLATTKHNHDFPWPATTYLSPSIWRRADLDIIDAREERKLWNMNLCEYPNKKYPAPN